MKKKKISELSPTDVSMYSSTGTTIQWIWGEDDDVPHFFLRRFEITPGNQIGLHNHIEEHEIFILSGEGIVFDDKGEETPIQSNDALFISPNEYHGYKNTGKTNLVFLCIIPRLKKHA